MISSKVKIIGAGVLAGIVLGAAPFVLKIETVEKSAVASTSSSFSDAQKTELNALVKDFILNNPTVILDSVNNHQKDQAKAQEEQGAKALAEFKDFFYKSSELPDAGSKSADVTIVEFFDYNCGYCKRAFEAVQSTLSSDKGTRFVFVDLPILSEQSRDASELALAAHLQGKYFEMHKGLMLFQGPKTRENILKIAKDVGLDTARLEADAKSPKVQDLLRKSADAAQKLAVSGTPAFILGDQIIRGFIPADAMQTMIKDLRSKKG
jgi:protein-disulfide isomerase